jgi:ribonuclease HI
MSHYPTRPSKPLSILQINASKGDTSHEIALSQAHLEQIDILLVQEPYVYKDLTRRITKRHPLYEIFAPIDDWTVGRPRVLTYIRKRAGLRTSQLRPLAADSPAHPDILFLHITSISGASLLIVNVYNAPPGSIRASETVKALTQLPATLFSQPTVIAGDLNLLHPRWQPSLNRGPTVYAEPFITWLDETQLVLTSPPDCSTHDLGNVLDLAFVSGQLALAGANTVIAYDLDVTSDHRPLLTTIPWGQRHQEASNKLLFSSLDQPLFLDLLAGNLPSLTSLTSPEQLDAEASGLTAAIHSAYRGSAKRSLGQQTGQPWWNEDCKQSRQQYRLGDCTKKDFRKAVRRAKTLFWQARLDTAAQAKDAFDISKWHKSMGSYRSPPLKDPSSPNMPLATTLPEKRAVLARNLLHNPSEVGDTPLDAPTVPITALPFPTVLDTDVERAILRTRNTAPGADEIPTCILQTAWPLIKDRVCQLFQSCLRLGHHPKCFRQAIIAIIQKPNKPDQSSPRSYRPIALLAVLGKGLERLIARNMAWVAVTYKVLANQQFGALPLRSAVDLTTCLTHDVEDALYRRQTASLLTLDVKGAFDAVLPGRLVRRLREQGWPPNLVQWVSSFATNRLVYIRLDGETGPGTDIQCGLPQGSPVSPILFMLYLAPLFKLADPSTSNSTSTRYGYADDVALLAISPSLETNSQMLSATLQEALDWGTAEGITFEPAKSELLHFSRRRLDQDPSITPSVSAGPITASENTERPYLRWLGVLFDKRLTFKWHVSESAAKALTVAQAIRSLNNTVRGVSPYLLRQVIIACVLRKAYFGAETWWPGRTRPSRPNAATDSVSNLVDRHLNDLHKVVLAGARAILPVFRTTPTAALYRESGLLPPEIELDQLAHMATVRLRRLDLDHPLQIRAEKVTLSRRPSSRFARRVIDLPDSERVNPIQYPPWLARESRQATLDRIHGPNGRTKEQAAKEFLDFYHQLPDTSIALFSDGSQLSDGRTGGGYVGYQANVQLIRGAFSLGHKKEVFDAEAEAALRGARAALNSPASYHTNDLWIFLDNLEVAIRLLGPSNGSSQATFQSFCELADSWPTRNRLPTTSPGAVRIRWVPGHAQVPGNDAADLAAKEGASLTPPSPLDLSLATLKRQATAKVPAVVQQLWQTVAPQSYRDLEITTSPLPPDELRLKRPTLGRILAARSGHGDFADYHERFNHADSHLLCSCGARKARLHFFFCRRAIRRAPRPRGAPSLALPTLLGTPKGAIELAAWLTKTCFYGDICPRHPASE